MPKLTDAQLVILSAACSRPDRLVMPFPRSLKGGAAQKVVASLVGRGLVQEIDADLTKSDPVWRKPEDGRPTTLIATAAACALIDAGNEAPQQATERPMRAKAAKGGTKAQSKAKSRRSPGTAPMPRQGTKQAELIAMLKGAKGATIAEIADAFGWQPHTVRGALAGALKKKLGLNVISEANDKRGRVYRIED